MADTAVFEARAAARRWLLALTVATVAGAAPAHQDQFAPSVALAERQLPLLGSGVLRYGLVFDVYAAALYGPPTVSAEELLIGDTAKRLELRYYRRIRSEQIVAAAETVLRRQLGEHRFEALRPALNAWHEGLRDVGPGDRYALEYDGRALHLRFNDRLVVSSTDPRLAAAYFGIWLADQPIDDELRQQLLSADGSRGRG